MYEWGKPTYEILGKKRSIIDVALTNNISQIKDFEVKQDILEVNAQTAHKAIQLSIKSNIIEEKCEKMKQKRLRHCSREALIRVRGEVERKLKMLRLIRGKRLSNIYNYRVLKRIYKNAKVKNIGYRKQGRNVTPSSMPIKTTQAKLMQTAGQINRVMRTEGEGQRRLKKIDALIQRYHILEKEIFEIWKREKQERWEQWIQ